MKRVLCGCAGILAVLGVASVLVGAAAATPAGGRIALFATVGNGPTGNIVVAGAIGDWGNTLTIDRDGKPDKNGSFVKVTLRKGTFEIDSTALNRKMANPRRQVASNVTCSVQISASSPVRLFDGTGLYKGISGTVNATITFAGVGGRYQTGPKKGQCEEDEASPLAMLGSVVGRGTVRFA